MIKGSVPNPVPDAGGLPLRAALPVRASTPAASTSRRSTRRAGTERRVACWLHSPPPFGIEHRPRYGTATPLPVARAAATGVTR